MKRVPLMALLICAAVVTGGAPAHAAVYMEPPTLNIIAEPGEKVLFTVRVVNDTRQRVSYYPLTGEYDPVSDTIAVPKSPYYDSVRMISGNLEFDRDVLTLNPGETREITGKIIIATALPTGTHHAVVAFVGERIKNGTTGIRLDPATPRTALTVMVQKQEKGEQLSLVTFNPFRKLFIGFPAKLTARIENGGTVALTPTLETRFSDEDGRGRGVIATDIPGRGSIGERSAMNIPVVWEGDGGYGKYRAHISVAYGSSEPQAATAEFWVFPWWMLALMALVLLVLSYGAARLIMRTSRTPQPDA